MKLRGGRLFARPVGATSYTVFTWSENAKQKDSRPVLREQNVLV